MTKNEWDIQKSWYDECYGRMILRELVKKGKINEKALLDEKLAEKLGSYSLTINDVLTERIKK